MSHNTSDTLQIAGLTLEIEGPVAWIEALRRLWTGWMGATGNEGWSLSLSVGAPAADARPLFEARPRFEGDGAHLTAPGFAAQIDPTHGTAHLKAHPQARLSDLAIFVRTCFALQAFKQGLILFHAAGIVRQGRGYALFGLSGSGKTTATSHSPPGDVLNDDLILIRPEATGWAMWATPFGENHHPRQTSAPLCALLRLVKAQEDRLEEIGPGCALGELVANSPVVNAHMAYLPDLLARWQAIVRHVPARALRFRKGSTFWEVLDHEFG